METKSWSGRRKGKMTMNLLTHEVGKILLQIYLKIIVLFILFPSQTRTSIGNEKLVIWDYHVIFVYKPDERRCLVFDLDSDLPFPTFFHKVK